MRGKKLCWSPQFLFQCTVVFVIWFGLTPLWALREFRTWSNRSACETAQWPGYIFAYSKYNGQKFESKGRTNTNLQDFRHECQLQGGASKCHICENIPCGSDYNSDGSNFNGGTCHLQLQGVSYADMSTNIPVVTDTAWAVSPTGTFRKNFGSTSVTHVCVFLSGGACIVPSSGVQSFTDCRLRCFGYSITPGMLFTPSTFLLSDPLITHPLTPPSTPPCINATTRTCTGGGNRFVCVARGHVCRHARLHDRLPEQLRSEQAVDHSNRRVGISPQLFATSQVPSLCVCAYAYPL